MKVIYSLLVVLMMTGLISCTNADNSSIESSSLEKLQAVYGIEIEEESSTQMTASVPVVTTGQMQSILEELRKHSRVTRTSTVTSMRGNYFGEKDVQVNQLSMLDKQASYWLKVTLNFQSDNGVQYYGGADFDYQSDNFVWVQNGTSFYPNKNGIGNRFESESYLQFRLSDASQTVRAHLTITGDCDPAQGSGAFLVQLVKR